jgi:hypothetical protein
MESRVMAFNVLPKLLVSRNNQLNEKAFQRALAKSNLDTTQTLGVYLPVSFSLSQEFSLQQLNREISSREHIVKIQNEINQLSYSTAESVVH